MKKITIKDIAGRLGMDYATISLAFNSSPRVSKATRQRILSEARKLGYVPNMLARNLQRKRTRLLGMVVPKLAELYMPMLVDTIFTEVFERGYRLQVLISNNDIKAEDEAIMLLLGERVEGLILVPASGPMEIRERPALQVAGVNRIPTVLFGLPIEGLTCSRVEVAMKDYTERITSILLSEGRAKTGLVVRRGGTVESYFADQQIEGFGAAMEGHGIVDWKELVFACSGYREEVELGREGATALWERHQGLQALMAGNDLIAEGFIQLRLFGGLGKQPEFSWFSLAGMSFSPYGPIAYGSSIVPIASFAQALAMLMMDQLDGRGEAAPKVVSFRPCRDVRHPNYLTEEEMRELRRREPEYVVREEKLIFLEKEKISSCDCINSC
jgi:LacI family transcriptional regulator